MDQSQPNTFEVYTSSGYASAVASYLDTVKAVYPHLGQGNRVRVGFCFVETVRDIFPDEEYTGFRYSELQKKGYRHI